MEAARRNALRGAQAPSVCAVEGRASDAESEGLGMAEQDDAPQGADNPTPDPSSAASAEDALRAAEGSVEKLKNEEASAPPAVSAAISDKANAALEAAKAALAAAKSAQAGKAAAPSPMAAAMSAAAAAPAAPAPTGSPVSLPSLQPGARSKALPSELDLLADVNLNVKIELGRTRMLVEDVLRLNEGSVVELDKLAGDPVDVFVNERHVARGEVLVVNDNFCIRISEILDAEAKESP